MLLHRLASHVQVVWIPSLLLQPRPGHLSWHEEEDQDGTIRVPQPRVVGRVGGRSESVAGPAACVVCQSCTIRLSGGKKMKNVLKLSYLYITNNVITANNVKKCPEPITLANFWPVTF